MSSSVKAGDVVSYTRDAAGSVFPAIVVRVDAHGAATLCAFTPAPEPVWGADHDLAGGPRTWRPLNDPNTKGRIS